jgi:hypothetical protein
MPKMVTRRDFMKGSASAVLGAAVGIPKEPPGEQADRSRVVLVRDASALDENSDVNGEVVQQMLDEAVVALFDADTPVDAFRTIISADQVVGIKTNVWRYLPTPADSFPMPGNRSKGPRTPSDQDVLLPTELDEIDLVQVTVTEAVHLVRDLDVFGNRG